MNCAVMCSSIWGLRSRAGDRRDGLSEKRAAPRPASLASIAVRPARLTTARLVSFWPMPAGWVTLCWIASSICPRNGRTTSSAAGRLASQRTGALRPSRSWRGRCWLRAFAAGMPAKWVTGDSVYGDDRRLRMWLEAQPQAYVLAVSGQEYVWLDGRQRQVKTILAALPEDGWTRLSAGDGAKRPTLV